MILTDSEDALSEEQFLALETLHRSEGSAWLGRGFTTSGDRGKVGLQPSCLEPCSRVDQLIHNGRTHSTRAIAREGPLHSEELFHLLKTVIQGEALGHAMQFAQRLRDTADEELVTSLETFVATAH